MKKSVILLLILIFNIEGINACLNYYFSVDNKGHLHSADDLQKAFNSNFNNKLIERKLKKLERQLKVENDYRLLSDYAVLLLKAGATKESIAILAQLSDHYPDEYHIASNLGTAYELNGDLEKAIQYIKKGIQLNPDAHEGSEWVHLKILETKIQLERDSSYLSKNTVLNLTEANKKDSLVKNQILIQVRERFPFSPGPNPIMASLLIDLGDCFANTTSIEFAKTMYTLAKLYYGANEDLVDPKINEMLNLRRKFATVTPEKRKSTGDNIKISGIRYKSMLDDNNPSNYKIPWENIVTDTDQLLTYANLEKRNLSIKTIPIDTVKTGTELTEELIVKNKFNTFIYIFSGIILLTIAAFLIFRKRA